MVVVFDFSYIHMYTHISIYTEFPAPADYCLGDFERCE